MVLSKCNVNEEDLWLMIAVSIKGQFSICAVPVKVLSVGLERLLGVS